MEKQLSSGDKLRLGRIAGLTGIGVNVVLFGVKLFAGLVSGSVSVIADAVNNITDAASSVLVLLGYVFAAKPPDKEHPFGHARMETLSSLAIAIIVTVLGIELFTGSVKNIAGGTASAVFSPVVVGIMVASAAAKIALAVYYSAVGKKIGSASLRASAMDSIGDVCATVAVIAGMLLAPVTGPATDGVLGCAIAVYIFIMGVKLILESVNVLLGEPPDVDMVREIVTRIRSYDGVLGIHDLVIHHYGMDRYFASVHVEMDAARDVMASHDIIDNIEADFAKEENIHLVIHLDPVSRDDEEVNRLRTAVQSIVAELAGEYASPMSMHDFRAVVGPTHTNLIFDIAVTHDTPLANREIVELMRQEIRRELGEKYNAVVTIDRDYVSKRYK